MILRFDKLFDGEKGRLPERSSNLEVPCLCCLTPIGDVTEKVVKCLDFQVLNIGRCRALNDEVPGVIAPPSSLKRALNKGIDVAEKLLGYFHALKSQLCRNRNSEWLGVACFCPLPEMGRERLGSGKTNTGPLSMPFNPFQSDWALSNGDRVVSSPQSWYWRSRRTSNTSLLLIYFVYPHGSISSSALWAFSEERC